MFVHEYQAKKLLRQYGFSFPPGGVAFSSEEAVSVAKSIDADRWVVKAQILAGDRGRFGGVKIAESVSKVDTLAKNLIGSRLVTTQTGADGLQVDAIYVEQGCEIERELYLAVLLDRYERQLVLLAAKAGGSGIETVVLESSQAIERITLSIDEPPDESELSAMAEKMELEGDLASHYIEICRNLHSAIVKLDALMIELNPLAVTSGGRLMSLDVKMEIDDNALFRHEEFSEIRETNQEPDRKLRAQTGYNYVRLDGDIGLLVSGAGLALATMDLLKLHGCEPANFLDLPPIASRSDVANACETVLQNSSLKALLVNVVGGGLAHCDTAAEGILTAHKKTPIKIPVVVRFAGTKKELGITLLRNSKMPFQLARTMSEAIAIVQKIR